jgi:integrase
MYKWAAAEELVSPSAYYAIHSLLPLKMNRTKAVDHPDVKPVDPKHVEAVFPYTTSVIRDMLQLQMLTGMRPDELTTITADRIDRSRKVWIYEPAQHKTKHLGKSRKIFIGPKAQAVLSEYLNRDGYLFSPAESERIRLAKLRAGRKTPFYGVGRPVKPRKTNDRYSTDSYRDACKYAQGAAVRAGVKLEEWTPYQIRHNVAQQLRDTIGIDTAAAILGHSDVETTKIYAKLDEQKAIEAAMLYG